MDKPKFNTYSKVDHTQESYNDFSLQPNFKPIDSIFENRLRTFVDNGGWYKELNLPKFYDVERTDSVDHIQLKVLEVPGMERPLFKDIKDKEFRPTSKGNSFGPSWRTFWFEVTIRIPEKWLKLDPERIELNWDCGNEGLIHTKDGMPLQAFSGGERANFSIPPNYWDGGAHVFYLEMACNGMFGNGDGMDPPKEDRYFYLSKADLVVPNMEARRLYWDFWVLGDAAREFPGDSYQKHQARKICNDIINNFDPEDVGCLAKCREIAKSYLGDDIDSDQVYLTKNKIDVYGVGNCHIDTAWLWPFDETKRKVVRSWTTQLRLMEEYPEYQFVASQAQQFKWLSIYHPEIFSQLKEKFNTNQFFPIGGSWVENDTNMPNGESLGRQFLLGQRFFQEHFGVQSEIFWLPDTFGYSSQVPQLCHLANMKKFLTQKLSWNNINSFPLSTFNWVGIDGSQVLVHMPPANTYTAAAHFGDVKRSQNQNKNLGDYSKGLLLYGHGDGGGGPTEEMLEKLRRCRGLSNNNGLLPTVHVGDTVESFYDDILKNTNQGEDLPTWNGEIYLEFHRGTYTTQADIKKYMRTGEVKLHDLEYVATLVSMLYPKEYVYPAKEINGLWETLCLCQFHDVLPGSCIEMVYEDAKPMLSEMISETEELISKAFAIVNSSSAEENFNFLNTLPWARDEIIELPSTVPEALLSKGVENSFLQSLSNGHSLVSMGAKDSLMSISTIQYPASVEQLDASTFVLSNQSLKATVKSGIVVSLYDLVNKREFIDSTKTRETKNPSGIIGANQYLIFDDEPLTFEAWDTELYSLRKFKFLDSPVEVTIHENGPLRSSIKMKHHISDKSFIETVISLDGLVTPDSNNNLLRFKCRVDWYESHKFLKVQFPTTIKTAQVANYETQFGITQRPTHYNTTWDVARFEVCHHKFMDLSAHNYGLSILNNCKYGGAIHGNLMRLSLLRSPKNPDAHADMGVHEFEYAIYPHEGPLASDTVKAGYNFNYRVDPAYLIKSSVLDDLISFKGDDSVVVSHLKRSEDDEGVTSHPGLAIKNKGSKSFVLRVYESLGGASKGSFTIDSKLPVTKVYKTNFLEEELEEIEFSDVKGGVEFEVDMRGFEIATYKIVL